MVVDQVARPSLRRPVDDLRRLVLADAATSLVSAVMAWRARPLRHPNRDASLLTAPHQETPLCERESPP
ncbi:MAG: hypothetical protein JWQ95_4508 [Sphaerisporangium sp.]|nr:hypothetical protein [Sphaerisporangium sp.]